MTAPFDGLTRQALDAIGVEVRYTPAGITIDGSRPIPSPCNDPACRDCDVYRDALRVAGDLALRIRIKRQIKRTNAALRRRRVGL